LRSLTLQGLVKRNVSIAAIARAPGLEHLSVDGSIRDLHVIRDLVELSELRARATAEVLESLEGHPSLRRLRLHRGTHRDLSALESCPQLADVEIWQIPKLTVTDLEPLARVPSLDALALGALRNVTTMSWLDEGRHRLRFLTLEGLPGLDSFGPLRRCSELVAFGAWESRPADRRLTPLHKLPLADLVLGDVYPPDEIAALLDRCRARVRIRGESPRGEPELHWRMLFEYADWHRRQKGETT
jgi:hypothetical protein